MSPVAMGSNIVVMADRPTKRTMTVVEEELVRRHERMTAERDIAMAALTQGRLLEEQAGRMTGDAKRDLLMRRDAVLKFGVDVLRGNYQKTLQESLVSGKKKRSTDPYNIVPNVTNADDCVQGAEYDPVHPVIGPCVPSTAQLHGERRQDEGTRSGGNGVRRRQVAGCEDES